MMNSEIVVALITGLCAVLGQWLISRRQSVERIAEDARRDQKINDELESIKRRLDAHNNYAAHFAEISTDIAVIKNDIKTLYRKEA